MTQLKNLNFEHATDCEIWAHFEIKDGICEIHYCSGLDQAAEKVRMNVATGEILESSWWDCADGIVDMAFTAQTTPAEKLEQLHEHIATIIAELSAI